MSTYSRYGSSGFRIGENSKPAPSWAGVQRSMIAPCGRYTNPSREVGLAAVFASSVRAGTIASSRGSASAAPAPFRNVRRGRCFLVMNIWVLIRRDDARFRRLHLLHERRALHDAEYDRRKPVILILRVGRDRADDRHVVVVEAAA